MNWFMAFTQFVLFQRAFGMRAEDTSEFWFAMVAGFITAYPVNWCLIRAGIREDM